MDTEKRRVTESNQRAGLACRGEATRNVKLLLRFLEALRIRLLASPADQESLPSFVSFCLLRHRDLHRLSSERESCFNLARYQGYLSKPYQQSRLVRCMMHLFSSADCRQSEMEPLVRTARAGIGDSKGRGEPGAC